LEGKPSLKKTKKNSLKVEFYESNISYKLDKNSRLSLFPYEVSIFRYFCDKN